MKDLTRILSCLVLGLALSAGGSTLVSATTTDTQQWNFRVYLDDSEIGYHNFTVTDFGEGREIRTEATFRVKFLFITAYKYQHVNTERWGGDCLERIESETNANGDRYSVTGAASEEAFVVRAATDAAEDRELLPECVMSFAYWDADFLQQPRLLNTQTGEYVDVAVQFAGDDILNVRGQPVPAYRYRLSAEGADIELWYSQTQEWLALETVTEGGRVLRYELT